MVQIGNWAAAVAKPLVFASLLLGGCGDGGNPTMSEPAAEPAGKPLEWSLLDDEGGAMLVLADASGGPQMRLICAAGESRLTLNVPAFRPVGSEERMTVGSDGTVETLVADPSGDRARGGVTASGAVPANLEAMLSGKVGANYGSQDSGPHPQLPPELLREFVNSCGAGEPEAGTDAAGTPRHDVSACLVQDGRRIPAMDLHAIGTEPFWAADVKGRCVTYSHPENQKGTRVWTQFSGSAANGRWVGALDGQKFVMATQPEAGCSDGMSDKRYPIAVKIEVSGELRRGCAEPKEDRRKR